jgi:hypothetical protein
MKTIAFTFTKSGRALVLAAVIGAVWLAGCGEEENHSPEPRGSEYYNDWGEWTVTTPATCDAAGVETRVDKTDASHMETRAIPKLTGAVCNTTGGNNNWSLDSRLICGDNEAWVYGGNCESAETGFVLFSNGYMYEIYREEGVWNINGLNRWRTNGNQLLSTPLGFGIDDDGNFALVPVGFDRSVFYEFISNDSGIITGGGERITVKKCRGVIVE